MQEEIMQAYMEIEQAMERYFNFARGTCRGLTKE